MKRLLILLCIAMPLMTACAATYMDWPSADHKDKWKKAGVTSSNVWNHFYGVCGYKTREDLRKLDPTLEGVAMVKKWESVLIPAEDCMLANGFTYDDEPAGFIDSKIGGICRRLDFQHRPSCQSLKNRNNQK